MFYLNSTLNFGIPQVFVFQLEVYYKVDRLLTGPTAQQKGTAARWYSNKTSLNDIMLSLDEICITYFFLKPNFIMFFFAKNHFQAYQLSRFFLILFFFT